MKIKRNGKSKFKYDCKVKKFGNLAVELKLSSTNDVNYSVEKFKVIFTKDRN